MAQRPERLLLTLQQAPEEKDASASRISLISLAISNKHPHGCVSTETSEKVP